MRFTLLLSALLLALPASAAEENSAKLTELSTTLGRAHAIQIVCNGRADQFWRDYMNEFLDLEVPGEGRARNELIEAFNAGFAEQSEQTTECDANAKIAFSEIAKLGTRLADELTATASGASQPL